MRRPTFEEPEIRVKEAVDPASPGLSADPNIAEVSLVLIFMAFLAVLGFGLVELLAA